MKMVQINTRGDALRHTIFRMVIAVCVTVILTIASVIVQFGADLEATVRVGYVLTSSIIVGTAIAALLAGALTFRSALLLKELTLTRAELLRVSRTDLLTGLLNRRGFDEVAALELAKAHDSNLTTTALMCDIDRFKAINDEFGHEFGDKVIAEIGTVLKQFGRDNGVLVARHGGEEFAALMTGVTTEQAAKYAEWIRATCEANEIVSDAMSARVTVSIGLTSSNDKTSLPNIMRSADQALYVAKHRGRNRVARGHLQRAPIAA
jgi:diguanylate cyclase (GGDEF)-like protein